MQRLSRLSKVQFYTGNYLDGFPGGATWETGGTIQHQLWPNGYRNWVPGFWHVLTHWWTWFGCVFLRCFCLLSESAVVSFFPAVDRFLQNPWADERPQHPQLLCSENRGRVLTHSMCLPQEHMIYHHIIIMFPLKHPFGGGWKWGVYPLRWVVISGKSTCFRICEHRKVVFLEVPKILSVKGFFF